MATLLVKNLKNNVGQETDIIEATEPEKKKKKIINTTIKTTKL